MKKDLEPTSRPLKRFCECDASELWRHDYPWLVPTGSHGMLPTSSQSSQPLIGLRCVGRVRSWKYLGAALNIGGTSEVHSSPSTKLISTSWTANAIHLTNQDISRSKPQPGWVRLRRCQGSNLSNGPCHCSSYASNISERKRTHSP